MSLVAQSASEAAEQQDHAKDRADAFLQSHTDALSGVEAWRQVSHLLARRRYILPGFPHSRKGANEQQDAYEKEHHRSALHQVEPALDALKAIGEAIQPQHYVRIMVLLIGAELRHLLLKQRDVLPILALRTIDRIKLRIDAAKALAEKVDNFCHGATYAR